MKTHVVVVLAAGRDQDFRRTVRNRKGEPVEQLIFSRDTPVKVPVKFYSSIARDIGHALMVCEEKTGTPGEYKPSWPATEAFREYLDTGKLPRASRKSKTEVNNEPEQQDEPLRGESVPE